LVTYEKFKKLKTLRAARKYLGKETAQNPCEKKSHKEHHLFCNQSSSDYEMKRIFL